MAERSRQQRQVLSEEEYTATLEAIVQRDYFPEIPKLERQAAVLERRSQGDVAGAVAVRRAAQRLRQHEEALAAKEDEDEHDLNDGKVRKRARPLHQETITGFHCRATNEDDFEFDMNQQQEVQANRRRLENLFRSEDTSNKVQVPLLAMASDQFAPELNRIAAKDWKKPAVRNGLFFNPTPQRIVGPQGITDSVLPITFGATPEQSALMPPPPAVPLRKVIPKNELVEYVPKHSLEKKIQPSETRFPDQAILVPRERLFSAHTNSELSETDGSVTDASTDLDAPQRHIEQERRSLRQRQERNQRTFVAMTPLLVPGTGNESPITTWGTVDSTPIVLSGQEHEEDSKPTSFSLPIDTKRERSARTAEMELARRAKRAKEGRNGSKPKRSLSATPSAQSLLRNPIQSGRRLDTFASELRTSYTPKLRSRSSSSSRRLRADDSAFNATPLASRSK